MPYGCLKQPHRTVNPGIHRHNHLRNFKIAGQQRRVKRPRASECSQHVLPRILAARLKGKTKIHRHIGVDDLENACRCLDDG